MCVGGWGGGGVGGTWVRIDTLCQKPGTHIDWNTWKTWKNENGHGKVMAPERIGKKSWNFAISHGIIPILPPNYTKFVCFYHHQEIEKWSWKSHGKIFCLVCGNPACL